MCRTQTDGPNRYPHNRIITRFIMAFGFYRFRISVCPRCSAIPCSKFSEAASERMTVFNSPVTRSRLASSEREPSLSVTDRRLNSAEVSSRDTWTLPLSACRTARPFSPDHEVATFHAGQQRCQVDFPAVHRLGNGRLLFFLVFAVDLRRQQHQGGKSGHGHLHDRVATP